MAGPRLNRVFLLGRLTRDPELRYTPNGTAVADLGLAVNDDYKAADGSWRERTCFVDITVWGRQAETSCEYLSKGRQALIEGRLQLDTWETNEGQKRSKLKVTADRVQFLGGPPRDGGGRSGGAPRGEAQREQADQSAPEPPADDDIPF